MSYTSSNQILFATLLVIAASATSCNCYCNIGVADVRRSLAAITGSRCTTDIRRTQYYTAADIINMQNQIRIRSKEHRDHVRLSMASSSPNNSEQQPPKPDIRLSSIAETDNELLAISKSGTDLVLSSENDSDSMNDESSSKAKTGTVNERLLAELEQAERTERFGARSSYGKKLGLNGFRMSDKTDEERQAAIDAARDLNGVNPIVAITGSLFALAAALGLWYVTSMLGDYFAVHIITTDVYFVARAQSVFRNVVMGLVSLASGFFGVTGLGILLLGIRVAYGVVTGELDPTPIKSTGNSKSIAETKQKLPSMAWSFMTGKTNKRGRR